MSWGVPDRDQTGHYIEIAKAQRKASGRDFDPKKYDGPTLESIYTQKVIDDAARLQAEEQARIAALTPREIALSTMTMQQRQFVDTWERINRRAYPGLE